MLGPPFFASMSFSPRCQAAAPATARIESVTRPFARGVSLAMLHSLLNVEGLRDLVEPRDLLIEALLFARGRRALGFDARLDGGLLQGDALELTLQRRFEVGDLLADRRGGLLLIFGRLFQLALRALFGRLYRRAHAQLGLLQRIDLAARVEDRIFDRPRLVGRVHREHRGLARVGVHRAQAVEQLEQLLGGEGRRRHAHLLVDRVELAAFADPAVVGSRGRWWGWVRRLPLVAPDVSGVGEDAADVFLGELFGRWLLGEL